MKKIVGILAGGLLAISSAQAGLSTASAISTFSGGNWTETLSLQQFNSALGTLTSVVFNYGGTVTSIFREENTSNESVLINASLSTNLVFGLSLGTLNFSNTASKLVGPYDLVLDFGGTSGFTTTPNTSIQSFSSGTINSGLATFTSPYSIKVEAQTVFTELGFASSSLPSTTASAKIDVFYTYDAPRQVPEPGSLALIGLALAGLGVMRRKSSKA